MERNGGYKDDDHCLRDISMVTFFFFCVVSVSLFLSALDKFFTDMRVFS